jgi:putative lipoprotein (rSAM/lipoprotein system)
MAKKMTKLPSHLSRMFLRLMSAACAFTFTFFVYATGQVIQSDAGSGSVKAASGLSKVSQDSLILVSPDYGVIPMYGIMAPAYGVIPLYGVPYADFTVKGTIKSENNQLGLANIKVTLEDTTSKTVVDSGFTAQDGSFSLKQTSTPWFNTWVFRAQDIDGTANGLFSEKDTLISIPMDSLKDSVSALFYKGKGVASIDLFLKELSTGVQPPQGPLAAHSSSGQTIHVSRPENGRIEAGFTLASPARTWMALYDAKGRLVRELFDKNESAGSHSAVIETSSLAEGAYFLKLNTDAFVSVAKIIIAR